eukprot:3780692-Amphidinium_carterae.1
MPMLGECCTAQQAGQKRRCPTRTHEQMVPNQLPELTSKRVAGTTPVDERFDTETELERTCANANLTRDAFV